MTASRICTKCGEDKPATLEFFYKDKRGKFGLKSWCKKCMKKDSKQFRQDNPDYMKQYCKDNKERYAEHNKQWHENNKENRAEYRRQWYEDNKDRQAEKIRIWKKDNPEKVDASRAKRRALKAGATVEDFTRQDVLDKWGTDCHICKKPVDVLDWHQEHVVPLVKGGEHSLANVKPSHPKCNLVKGSK